jgi:hypothetical protein
MDTNPAMRDGFQPAKYTNGISGFISAFSLQNSALLHSTLNSQLSTITDRRTIRLNRPWLNDNEPSSVPRAASRISFESMPKD